MSPPHALDSDAIPDAGSFEAHFLAESAADGVVNGGRAFSMREESQIWTDKDLGGMAFVPSQAQAFYYDVDPIRGAQLDISVPTWTAATGEDPPEPHRGLSLNSTRQLIAEISADTSYPNTVEFGTQFEFMVNDSYQRDHMNTIGANGNFKFFTWRNSPGDSADKVMEFFIACTGDVGDGWVFRPGFRVYNTFVDEPYAVADAPITLDRPQDPQFDYQPSFDSLTGPEPGSAYFRNSAPTWVDHLAMVAGDPTKPYLVRDDEWNLVTCKWQHIDDKAAKFWCYMSSESTPPCLVISSKTGDGMIFNSFLAASQKFYPYNIGAASVEHNSSDAGNVNLDPTRRWLSRWRHLIVNTKRSPDWNYQPIRGY